MRLLTPLLLLTSCFQVQAQNPSLQLSPYRNLDFITRSSRPGGFLEVDGQVFFQADDVAHGEELWVTDGTNEGTMLVKDTRPGPASGEIETILDFNGRLFFSAIDTTVTLPPYNTNLWISDGTQTGTQKVLDGSGNPAVSPSHFTLSGEHVFFITYSSVSTSELWVSDGTPAGTLKLLDRNFGLVSPVEEVSVAGGLFYFTAATVETGKELWVSDGTESGTRPLKEIVPGPESIETGNLRPFGDRLFFSTINSGQNALYLTDGTMEGTVRLSPENAWVSGTGPLLLDGRLFFSASIEPGPGQELWTSDGTVEGTYMVKDLYPGSNASSPEQFLSFNGQAYFFASDEPTSRLGVWHSDGTADGTQKVFAFEQDQNPLQLTPLGDQLFLNVENRLYAIDQSDNVAVIQEGYPEDITLVGGDLFFRSGDALRVYHSASKTLEELIVFTDESRLFSRGDRFYFVQRVGNRDELWTSDGSPAGTALVYRLNHPLSEEGARLDQYLPRIARIFEDQLLLAPNDVATGEELWISDGRPAGARLLKDINRTTYDVEVFDMELANEQLFLLLYGMANDREDILRYSLWSLSLLDENATFLTGAESLSLAAVNNKAVFTKYIAENSLIELWASDGTAAGTQKIETSVTISNNDRFYRAGANLFIYSRNQLVVTDGTSEGTRLLTTFQNLAFEGLPEIATIGNLLFFNPNEEKPERDLGRELWVSDGTTEGTFVLADINEGPEDSDPTYLTRVGNRLYFVANRTELWKTDGTISGTERIGNLDPIPSGTFISDIAAVGNVLYISAAGTLWRMNLVSEAVELVKSDFPLNAFGTSSSPADLQGSDNNLFFFLRIDQQTSQFWVSRGTAETTQMLLESADVGTAGGWTGHIGLAFFATFQDEAHGQELWISDGSVSGTRLLEDLLPGPESSSPRNLIDNGNRIYFTAANPSGVQTIYAIDYVPPVSITGTAFHDDNLNGERDQGETGIPGIEISADPHQALTFTAIDGSYEFRLEPGEYQFSANPGFCWESTDPEMGMDLTYYGLNNTAGPDFGFKPVSDSVSLALSITAAPFRCGFTVPTWVTVRNTGCQTLSGTVRLTLSNLTHFVSAQIDPLYADGQDLVWNFVDLAPDRFFQLSPNLKIAGEESIGEFITLLATAGYDNSPLETSKEYTGEIRCAIDPNDKLVSPARPEQSGSNYTQFEEVLEYTIRFQNTGNDTAFNVRITDQLSPRLDWASFKPGVGSHPYHATLDDTGLLEFYFRNILLRDSTTSEPASHGFVQFAISAKTDLTEGEVIDNEANIFFDFNKPILTPPVKNTFVEMLDADEDGYLFYEDCFDDNPWAYPGAPEIAGNGVDEDCDGQDLATTSTPEADLLKEKISIFPNPAGSEFQIEKKSANVYQLIIYDLRGVPLGQYRLDRTRHTLSTESWPAGALLLRFIEESTGLSSVRIIMVVK
ncbi:MAG: MopE-related protein [Saprospiraceae bacterium]